MLAICSKHAFYHRPNSRLGFRLRPDMAQLGPKLDNCCGSASPLPVSYLSYQPAVPVTKQLKWICVKICIQQTQRTATSRARASRVTKVSREGEPAYKDKGEPIGTAPDHLAGTAVDCVISCPWHFLLSTSLPDNATVWVWLALVTFESWQPFRLPAVWLDVFSLSDISLSTSSSDDGTLSPSDLWILTASFLLTAQEPGTEVLSWQISFPTLLTPVRSSLLFPFCFLLSSVPYSLHFPTLFNCLLFSPPRLPSSYLYCLDISTLFTSLLHIPTLFTSFFLHIATL